jgi:hypothetical protein
MNEGKSAEAPTRAMVASLFFPDLSVQEWSKHTQMPKPARRNDNMLSTTDAWGLQLVMRAFGQMHRDSRVRADDGQADFVSAVEASA